MNQIFASRMHDLVDELFPKLNENDTSKPSPNNRSAALVFCAKACMLAEEVYEDHDPGNGQRFHPDRAIPG